MKGADPRDYIRKEVERGGEEGRRNRVGREGGWKRGGDVGDIPGM